MSLRDQIRGDQDSALKQGKKEELSLLRLLSSAMKNVEIDKRKKELSDEETQEVVQRLLKQLRDALQDFTKADRKDLVAQTRQEISFLEKYLPEPMTEEELVKIISEVINEKKASGPQDLGKVMGAVVQKTKGRADGGKVREEVMKQLTSTK